MYIYSLTHPSPRRDCFQERGHGYLTSHQPQASKAEGRVCSNKTLTFFSPPPRSFASPPSPQNATPLLPPTSGQWRLRSPLHQRMLPPWPPRPTPVAPRCPVSLPFRRNGHPLNTPESKTNSLCDWHDCSRGLPATAAPEISSGEGRQSLHRHMDQASVCKPFADCD